MAPDPATRARFAADLDSLVGAGARLALAVSGGPDSLALLLLAAEARPGAVEAATVDHALRQGSDAEAAMVAALCATLGVPHRTLTVAWDVPPASAIQERARDQRYALLAGWMRARGLTALATGHHRDDQAETMLMRLARGSGVRGLGAMRASSALPGAPDLRLLRPLLRWGRGELEAVCVAAGVTPLADPSNADERFERVRIRRLLRDEAIDPAAVAASAAHCAEADAALDWSAERAAAECIVRDGEAMLLDPHGLPAELRRRIVAGIVAGLAREGHGALRGRDLDGLLAALDAGRSATLRGVKAVGGARWRFEPAPTRAPRA